MTLQKNALNLHKKFGGKIKIALKTPIRNRRDLNWIYTPGVAAVSSRIARNKKSVNEYTWRQNLVAVISDGSAVLGLGNIGPEAALPVMEGKCAIFKQFADIDAVPIVLGTQNAKTIIEIIKNIAPSFSAIQLEDISAPRCFEIEKQLQKILDMPVMHDDQHGTAIVVLAGLINAAKVVGKKFKNLKVIISGAGAAGTAVSKLLIKSGIKNIIVHDRTGAIFQGRKNLNPAKKELAKVTNPLKLQGSLEQTMANTDAFIGLSVPRILTPQHIKQMSKKPIIFALANPTPEIMPQEAKKAGAAIIATGRSDFENQINNALVYPGLFRGLLDYKIKKVTDEIKIKTARALANFTKNPSPSKIIPSIFEKKLVQTIAKSLKTR